MNLQKKCHNKCLFLMAKKFSLPVDWLIQVCRPCKVSVDLPWDLDLLGSLLSDPTVHYHKPDVILEHPPQGSEELNNEVQEPEPYCAVLPCHSAMPLAS